MPRPALRGVLLSAVTKAAGHCVISPALLASTPPAA